MSTQRERFQIVLTGQYEHFHKHDARYAYVAQNLTPAQHAEKMVAALATHGADKDGDAVKATCKALGVKHTYKAIREFLAA